MTMYVGHESNNTKLWLFFLLWPIKVLPMVYQNIALFKFNGHTEFVSIFQREALFLSTGKLFLWFPNQFLRVMNTLLQG